MDGRSVLGEVVGDLRSCLCCAIAPALMQIIYISATASLVWVLVGDSLFPSGSKMCWNPITELSHDKTAEKAQTAVGPGAICAKN